jgi:LuxR family transcriptional regulator, maltose regulon positive regulatory protein
VARSVPEILSTKLYVPPPRPSAIDRPRLRDRLNEGMQRKLTLIAAPAGFGKTTLVSGWAADGGWPVAWLSLDQGDSEPTRFLTYLVAALQTIDSGLGERASVILRSAGPAPDESALTTLINDVASVPDDFILALDDYHAIDSPQIDDAVTFLIEHLPPPMHLAIVTREDPRLPLARLRARGQLTELRAPDLRFTHTEAAEFLNRVMGLDLEASDIAALEKRTEGWVAGLQMAALSLQGRLDTTGFIQAFTGSHRFVLDYLVEEVLERQPEHVRSFLLRTAVLDRLSGPLCDAVAERDDGRAMLEVLERANLFVTPLDDDRHWYRYHHLFAEVLRARLMETEPQRVSGLHRRASEWHEQNGLPSDAIHHAFAAGDLERAAGLIELAWPEAEEGSRATTWLGWVKALPDGLVRDRPVLSVWCAYALLASGAMELADARLTDAERWLDPATPSAGMVVVDEGQFRSLPAIIAIGRAYRAHAVGDVDGAMRYAQRALDTVPDGDLVRQGQATALLGLTSWANGDLGTADRVFADYHSRLRAAGNLPDAIGTAFVVSEIRVARGRLRDAFSTLERSIRWVTEQDEPLPPEVAELHRGLAELCRERGEPEAATRHLERATELGTRSGLSDHQRRLCVAQARMRKDQGDAAGALHLLDEAERHVVRNPLPDVRPIAAVRTRIWIAEGRSAEALAWAKDRGLSSDDAPSYLREFEHLTLARALIAQHKSDRRAGSIEEALALLGRSLAAAEAGRRMGSVIEILVLQALAHEADRNVSPALTSLKRALTLAEPEGYVRLFVDEGPPMARLLDEAAARGMAADYARRLLTAFRQHASRHASPSEADGAPVRLLSVREREVLGHIAEGLTNREIADRLFLSVHTVKAHARSINEQLEANSRTHAVAKARDLGILPRA